MIRESGRRLSRKGSRTVRWATFLTDRGAFLESLEARRRAESSLVRPRPRVEARSAWAGYPASSWVYEIDPGPAVRSGAPMGVRSGRTRRRLTVVSLDDAQDVEGWPAAKQPIRGAGPPSARGPPPPGEGFPRSRASTPSWRRTELTRREGPRPRADRGTVRGRCWWTPRAPRAGPSAPAVAARPTSSKKSARARTNSLSAGNAARSTWDPVLATAS